MTFILQPSWGPDEVFEAMKKCAKDLGDPGWDPVNGFGLATAGCTWEYAERSIFFDGFESGDTSKWTVVSGGTS